MQPKRFFSFLILMFFVITALGCETAKGFTQDVKNTWSNLAGPGTQIQKADNWIKENLW